MYRKKEKEITEILLTIIKYVSGLIFFNKICHLRRE
jgi:hypothetical protein